MSEKFKVEIISPEKSILQTEASEVVIPSFEGEMGIMKDHIPLITFLRPGSIKIMSDPAKEFFVEEGTVEFENNNLLILTSTAKNLLELKNNFLDETLKEAEEKFNREEISDKEKYLLSYKINFLKNISQ